MAPTKKTAGKDLYSVILPTFNERQNLPIITWLLNRTFTEQYVTIIALLHQLALVSLWIPSY